MLNFSKLWILLNERGMKRTDLLNEPIKLSSATLAKLGKNQHVSTSSIEKICDFLECQPGDIMENITEKDIATVSASLEKLFNTFLDKTAVVMGEDKAKELFADFENNPELKGFLKNGKLEISETLIKEFNEAKSKKGK